MNKIKITLLIALFGGVVWILSGGVSASREKIAPQIWKAVGMANTEEAVDTDKDGLSDDEEKKIGTDPNNPDTDGDKFFDGQEKKSGYDPLKPAPGDRVLSSNLNSNSNSNINSNSNSNTNTNTNSNANTNSGETIPTGILVQSSSSGQTNVTEEVAKKVDDMITRYNLYKTPYTSLDEATKAELEKELNGFSVNIIKDTGLDFQFNIPDETLRVNDSESTDKNQYLARSKDILRKHNLIEENQTIEDGIRKIIGDLSVMSKNDIDWGKANIWKREAPLAHQELLEMPINSQFKSSHVRLLRVIKSMEIVFNNLNESDYFRSFLAAGRSEKISGELEKFTQELK